MILGNRVRGIMISTLLSCQLVGLVFVVSSFKPKQNTLATLGLPLFLIYWRETGFISTAIPRPCPPHSAMPVLLADLFHPHCPIKQINSTVDNKVYIPPVSSSFPYTRVPQHNTVTVGSR